MTGVDALDDNAGNNDPTPVFNKFAPDTNPAIIAIPGRSRREFALSFGNFQRPENRVRKSRRVTLEMPMPNTASIRVPFIAS